MKPEQIMEVEWIGDDIEDCLMRPLPGAWESANKIRLEGDPEDCFIRPLPGERERAKKIKFDPEVSEQIRQFLQEMRDRELEEYDHRHGICIE